MSYDQKEHEALQIRNLCESFAVLAAQILTAVAYQLGYIDATHGAWSSVVLIIATLLLWKESERISYEAMREIAHEALDRCGALETAMREEHERSSN